MIKNLFFVALYLLLTNSCFSQESTPTTETEYNYITKGYKIQVSSGLDMKAGYTFENIDIVKIGTYTYEIKALVRNEKQEIAALMVITKSNSSGITYYFCIPHGNSDLNQRYYNDLSTWDKSITTPYAYMMSTKFESMMNKYVELGKKLKK